MKQTAELTIKLFVITAIVAALLSAVNLVTAPVIARNTEAAFQENMRAVLPDADTFTESDADVNLSETGVRVDALYEGTAGGQTAGYVASVVCSEGYGGDITVMVGVNADLTVNQVTITEMSETPGLGAKASEPSFIDQYQGLSYQIEVDKNGSAAGAEQKVSAISGATITSRAVTKAVNAALEAAEQAEGGVK